MKNNYLDKNILIILLELTPKTPHSKYINTIMSHLLIPRLEESNIIRVKKVEKIEKIKEVERMKIIKVVKETIKKI